MKIVRFVIEGDPHTDRQCVICYGVGCAHCNYTGHLSLPRWPHLVTYEDWACALKEALGTFRQAVQIPHGPCQETALRQCRLLVDSDTARREWFVPPDGRSLSDDQIVGLRENLAILETVLLAAQRSGRAVLIEQEEGATA